MVNVEALSKIELCGKWYKNEEIEDFHLIRNLNGREVHMNRMNFAKRCCADDANLCEVVSVVPAKSEVAKEFISRLMQKNRFEVQYRKQLEKTSAIGTTGAYLYLKDAVYMKTARDVIVAKGGEIRINYCDGDGIIPLTVENDEVTECAFSGTGRIKGKERTTLVIFTLENGCYQADTVIFDAIGRVEEENRIGLGEVKPFSILRNAEVNNLDNMAGYGIPKIYHAMPILKAIDVCYNVLYGDLSKGEKLVFLNEKLAEIRQREDGSLALTPQQKDLFVMLGEKLPEQDSVIKEYNPEIRIEQVTKVFELLLSLLSMSFGYGTKKYTFENGKITTATEYIGNRQDSMQELNKQRRNATNYILDLIRGAMWFSNQFHGTSYDLDEELNVQFDDSYIEDRKTKLESMRADAVTFSDIPILLIWYLMEKYNKPEEEIRKYLQQGTGEDISGEDAD